VDRFVIAGGLLLAGLLVALYVQGRIMRRLVKAGVAMAGLVLLYLGFTFAQVWWASAHDDRPVSSAIVVLGAAQWDGRPSPVLRARLDHAAELYRAGVAPIVVVTGSKQEGDRVGEAFAGYDYLKDQGLPEAALKIENNGTDTYEELSASRHILDAAKRPGTVVLVSSPYHGFRAKAIADEVGLEPHFSPAADESSLAALVRETAAVSVGRLISYRRLSVLQ
jgi:uncharacterized SAM-binding protein YcdF (DUF218 family)